MRSATETCLRPCVSAKASICGPFITVPSSLASSQITPTGGSSARRHRSTAASVWPERMSTPPSRAMSGKTWPGRTKSPAPMLPLASARTVLQRCSAEIPVVRPCLTSTVTVKAVPSGASFDATMGARCSRRASLCVIGAQTMPQVLRMMNAIFSGVQSEAATTRSPSFSRSSSSVTTTISPRAKAAMASVTEQWGTGILESLGRTRIRAAIRPVRDGADSDPPARRPSWPPQPARRGCRHRDRAGPW